MLREKLHFQVPHLGLQLVFLFFILSLFFPKYSFAQIEEPRWERMGLEGWEIIGNPAVAINPVNPRIIYTIAQTDNPDPNSMYSKIYDLLKTTDGGITWVSKKNGLPTNNLGIGSIAIDPNNPDTLFITAGEGWGPFRDGGIYKTTNGGDTWTRVLRGIGYINLAVDFENPNLVFALNAGVNNPTGFYKSIDGGISWERKGAGIITYSTYYRRIVLDPTDHSIVYVLANPFNGTSGLFKSTDRGEHFISIPDNVGLVGQFHDIAIDYTNNQILYAASTTHTDNTSGVYKSINGGNTWFRSSDRLDSADARTIEMHPNDSNILYIPAYKARLGQGVLINSPYYSTDNGQTWIPFINGQPQNGAVSINEMFTRKNQNYILATSQDGLWKYPLITSVSPSPTPTPTPCVLQNFGDGHGNPVKQTDIAWASEPYAGWTYTFPDGHTALLPFIYYGGSRDNIANWGCTLTSYAMMLNYYAQLDGKTWRTNPYDLNQWLQQHNGYASGPVIFQNGQPHHVNDGNVSWQGIVAYAAQNPSYLYFSAPRTGVANADNIATFMQTADENIIRPALCSQETKEPVMLKVINKNWVNGTPTPYPHFVVASGIEGDAYRLHDPLRDSIVTLQDQYESTFYKYTKLVRSTLSASTSFHVFSPVELLITDSLGRKTGYDPETDEHFQQIPDSEYIDDSYGAVDGASRSHKVLNLFSPIDGLYQLKVVGTGSGSYTIQQTTVDENGAFQSMIVGGNAAQGSNHIFDVQFDTKNATSSTDMIRQIDIDIKPHGKYNFVNPNSNDAVQVAILGTPTFDATKVDFASVVFGSNKIASFKKVPLITDVDKDGDQDYLVYFKNKGSGIVEGDTEVCIEGQTTDFIPVPFKGCGAIQTIPQ